MFLLASSSEKCPSHSGSCIGKDTIFSLSYYYCSRVLASAPKKVTDKLQPVQNTATRLITGTQKHEHGLSWLLRDWLTIPQRVQYKLAVSVHRCLRYRAPRYLADCRVPVSEVSGRKYLRSASRRKLNIRPFRRSTFGTCGLSQSPVRRFGTHCLIRCVIRPSSLNALGGT